MSSLSGQQINQSYQGLLKLSTSSTGITSTFQAIEDGLGNDTNSKISTSGILSPNLISVPTGASADGGIGTLLNASTSVMSWQGDDYDAFFYYPFYDAGINTYTSLKVRLTTATSTSDVVTGAFYTIQNSNAGIGPKDVIMSGISIPTTGATGSKTITLSPSLKFPQAGYYMFCFLVTNTGVGPTAIYSRATDISYSGTGLNLLGMGYGFNENTIGKILSRQSNLTLATGYYDSGNIPFKSSYSAADLVNYTYFSNTKPIGFVLS